MQLLPDCRGPKQFCHSLNFDKNFSITIKKVTGINNKKSSPHITPLQYHAATKTWRKYQSPFILNIFCHCKPLLVYIYLLFPPSFRIWKERRLGSLTTLRWLKSTVKSSKPANSLRKSAAKILNRKKSKRNIIQPLTPSLPSLQIFLIGVRSAQNSMKDSSCIPGFIRVYIIFHRNDEREIEEKPND